MHLAYVSFYFHLTIFRACHLSEATTIVTTLQSIRKCPNNFSTSTTKTKPSFPWKLNHLNLTNSLSTLSTTNPTTTVGPLPPPSPHVNLAALIPCPIIPTLTGDLLPQAAGDQVVLLDIRRVPDYVVPSLIEWMGGIWYGCLLRILLGMQRMLRMLRLGA